MASSSRGYHPYSNYMTSEGQEIYAMSNLDVIIDIADVYFPLRSLSYSKNMEISDEHGTGSLDPYALPNHQQTYTGSFTYASFLVNGEPSLTTHDKLALEALLEDQEDEGRSKYFDIIIMEVPGKHNANFSSQEAMGAIEDGAGVENISSFIEALIDCKLTKSGREYPEKGTIVTQREFKFSRRIPR